MIAVLVYMYMYQSNNVSSVMFKQKTLDIVNNFEL
jgi:hypothetical protein